MTTLHTDGRALADAASLARKLTMAAHRVAMLTIVDGRAELVTGDGATGITEVVGHGTAPDGTRVAIAVDLDHLRTLRGVGEVTIRDTGAGWSMTAVGERDGVTSSVTSTLADLAREVPTWPTFPGVVDPVVVDVRGDEAASVADALRSVARAADTTSYGREVLAHVLVGDGEAAATDTYRLNLATIPTDGGEPALVPAAWLAAIPARGVDRLTIVGEVGAAELTYRVTTRGRSRSVAIVGRVSGEPFPNSRALIPAEDDRAATVTIPSGIGEVVRRMTAPVTMSVGEVADLVTLTDAHGSTATIGTATTGTVEVAANGTYLRDLADHVGPGATLALRDGLRAMIATGEGRTTLLMPMRA
jgi:hypothetical protein